MDQPAACRVCETGVLDHVGTSTGVCSDCRGMLGIIEMPPPRRPARPCAACNKLRFIRVIPREYTAFGHVSIAAPMYLTRNTGAVDRSFFPGKALPDAPALENGRGLLEAYVCASCGHIDWYCHDPEAIPIGPEFMSVVVDYEGGGPYR